MKQVAPPPCPEWVADNEFNVSLWARYVFTGNTWQNDRYIEADHAWARIHLSNTSFTVTSVSGLKVGRLMRGIQQNVFIDFSDGIFENSVTHENNAIGAVLGNSDVALSISLFALFALHFWRRRRNFWRWSVVNPSAVYRTRRRIRRNPDGWSYRQRDEGIGPGRRRLGNSPYAAYRLGQGIDGICGR